MISCVASSSRPPKWTPYPLLLPNFLCRLPLGFRCLYYLLLVANLLVPFPPGMAPKWFASVWQSGVAISVPPIDPTTRCDKCVTLCVTNVSVVFRMSSARSEKNKTNMENI
jgi:hypothetical protein